MLPHFDRQGISSSSFLPSKQMGLCDVPHVFAHSAAAAMTGDAAALKARLASIIDDVQSATLKEGNRSLAELCTFFDTVAEQSGTHIQHIFGQHVTNNTLFVVMDSVVKPALTQYCAATGRRRQVAARRVGVRNRAGGSASQRRLDTDLVSTKTSLLSSAAAAEEDFDVFNSSKAKQLRADVVRPWRMLVETIHHGLPASLHLKKPSFHSFLFSSPLSSSTFCSSRADADDGSRYTTATPWACTVGTTDAATSSFSELQPAFAAGSSCGGGRSEAALIGHNVSEVSWAALPNHTWLPLLWKNAVPLFSITRHALDVLQSEVLAAVCGQEYAQLLLHLLLFEGYISNLQPGFIVELTIRLLQLLEATVYEFSSTNNSLSTGQLLQENGDVCGCSSGGDAVDATKHEGDCHCPSVEEGTIYAALLVQVFRAPQLMSAFAPCEDKAGLQQLQSEPTTPDVTIPFVIQRLVCLATRRHLRPTSALRLEAHLLIALNLLVSGARDDYPLASAAPLELVKPLCHLFYSTIRRDGWRMEALSFMTTQICVCFSAVLGQSVREDIERTRPTTIATHQEGGSNFGESGNTTGKEGNKRVTGGFLSLAPRNLTLLHETVLPFTLNFFAVTRSEFSFVLRRELFHFPCVQLAPLFEFGAVVLYLACCTYEAYMALPSSVSLGSSVAENTGGKKDDDNYVPAPQDVCSSTCNVDSLRKNNLRAKKRPRENEFFDDKLAGGMEVKVEDLTHMEPSDALLTLFRSFFFMDCMRNATKATTSKTKTGAGTAVVATPTTEITTDATKEDKNMLDSVHEKLDTGADADNLLLVGVATAGQLSAAAVQELVKDGSLFMMHILAQPCTTLGFSEQQCSSLVENGVLPLFPYYGVRLESLLFAVLHAVAPRASVKCQNNVFCWLVRRYMATVATQRDEENQPKEQVYRLLSVLLERCIVGQWPLVVQSEECNRLHAAAHFCAINACFNTLFSGNLTNTASSLFTTTLPSVIKAGVTAISAGQRAKLGFASTMFLAMLRFLSLYQHYCATSADTILAYRLAGRGRQSRGGCGSADRSKATLSSGRNVDELVDVASAPVHFLTGLKFVICGISHAVCFYSDDEGVCWRGDADTAAAASAFSSAAVFFQTLRCVEDYVVAVSLLATKAELCQHRLLAAEKGVAVASKSATPFSHCGGSKAAASLQKMKLFFARSRSAMEAEFLAPQKHVPTAVCDAAEGHWLLLHEFLASSSSPFTRADTKAVTVPAVGFFGDGDGEEFDMLPGRLRRGDVPFCVVETVAAEVTRVVGELAERIKIVATASGGSGLQQKQQEQQGADEETVASTHRMICIHSIQLLHLLLRLFRLGIWQLPQTSQCQNNETGEVDDHERKRKDSGVDEDDLCILSNLPQAQLFDNPSSVFRRLSRDGQLYYAVMWLCRHLATRLLRGSFVHERVVLRALLVFFNDVGTVFLSRSFALWEPRQVVLSFAGVVCRRALEEGIAKISLWPPTGVNSAEAVALAQMTIRLSCSLLGVIFTIVRRTRVLAASNDPLVSPARVATVLFGILEKDGLIPAKDFLTGSNSVVMHQSVAGGCTNTHDVLKLNPFLPFSLSVIDSIVNLLRTLHLTCDDAHARLALRQLLETLFARYRHGLAESIFLSFGYYAPSHHALVSSFAVDHAESEGEGYCSEEEESNADLRVDAMFFEEQGEKGENFNAVVDGCEGNKDNGFACVYKMKQLATGDSAARQNRKGRTNKKSLSNNAVFMPEEGRLLEMFVDQLVDVSRSDMPVVTPKLQCAVLSGICGLLFCCDAPVAEKLGKYLFSFLSTKTAYVVRRHTAFHVRWLFSRFSRSAYLVLQELLYRAREGIASMSTTHCATSMRALGEAAMAVPMMEADIICTLLECWATRGFAHKGLVLECLGLIAGHARLSDDGGTVGGASTAAVILLGERIVINAQQLCHYHRERLLFDWLWRLGHQIEAFPVACLGFTKTQQMWEELMPTLLPLALLCSARRGSYAEKEDETWETSVFLQPNDLLWRLAECHYRSANASFSKHECRKEMLLECIVAYFPDVMARLFVFAALQKCREAKERGDHQVLLPQLNDVADAANVALEWLRTTLSSKYIVFLRHYADAILCRFVDLAGVMAPTVRLQDLHGAASMLCESLFTSAIADSSYSQFCVTSSVDAFFESDAGDHAYVLLHRLYVALTSYVHRGSRRRVLAIFFEHIVRRWWRRETLQRLPHVLHTILRLCGNILMTCVDARPRVCGVLLYVWTAVTSSLSSSRTSPLQLSLPSLSFERVVVADKVFLSTIMLSLVEDSRVVAATWAAICRSDKLLQRRDWQLKHARSTLGSVDQERESHKKRGEKTGTVGRSKEAVAFIDDSDEQEAEELRSDEKTKTFQQERSTNCNGDSKDFLAGTSEIIRRVEEMLPLLQSTVFVAGAPASSFYSDVAAAVDRNRVAFVTIIRMYIQQCAQGSQPLSLNVCVLTRENYVANVVQRTYETCCRVMQHLLALICMDDILGVTGRIVITPHFFESTIATGGNNTANTAFATKETTGTASAGLIMLNMALVALQGTNYGVQLNAFCLLRSLCWCFIEAGAESHVDALFYPTGAVQEMLQRLPFDEVLHRMYRQHIEQLYRLSFDADAYVAHIASTTLRGWICGSTANNCNGEASGGVGDFAGRGEISTGQHVLASSNSTVGIRSGCGDDGSIIKRTLELFRAEEAKMMDFVNNQHENDKNNGCSDSNNGVDEGDECFNPAASVRLEDINAFRRCLVGVSVSVGMTSTDAAALDVLSLLSDAVWEALFVHGDESRFLRFFTIAIVRHYNLHYRFCTLAVVLRSLLLQPLVDKSGSLLLFMESFLPVVFLHAMLLKESETQRAQRRAWSQLLEKYLFSQASCFCRTARLFLRTLHVCHSALMTVVRSYGVCFEGQESHSLARMSPSELETAEVSLSFPFFVNSEYGKFPLLSDMRESYWLSDIDPLVLASAAVECHEPHLALIFAEISGESLLGRRKGIPSAAMAVVGQPKFSALFPSMQGKPFSEGCNQSADGRRGGRQLRGDEAQAEMAQRLLTYRASVQAIRVDAEALLRFRDFGNGSDGKNTTCVFDNCSALPFSTDREGYADGYSSPMEEKFFMNHPMRLFEREKSRGNWHSVLLLLDTLDDADALGNRTSFSASVSSSDDRTESHKSCFKMSRCRRLVERAHALMQLGAFDTALQVLAPALKQTNSTSFLSVTNNSKEKNKEKEGREEEEEEEKAQLRAVFASALWRLGRWDAAFLEDEKQHECFHHHHGLSLPSFVSVDEAVFFALRSAHRGEHHDVRRWTAQAQMRLASRIDATNWFCTMLHAEVLHNIEEASDCFMRCSSASLSPSASLMPQREQQVSPPWVHASLEYVHAPYRELEFMDSVHQRLCVVYRQPQWWLSHLKVSSERALRSNKPLLVRQWLSAYAEMKEHLLGACGNDSVLKGSTTCCNMAVPLDLPVMAFLALLQARAEFVSGHPHRAIAILQNVETASSKKNVQQGGFLFPIPADAVQMPAIVHQLVLWAKEARLVPLSQLVRDPCLLLSVKNDKTGVCCLQLARLCHTLVRDIATRLHTEEYRKLRSSIEASINTRAELEHQQQQRQAAGNLSEAENKILRHRIRTLAAETLREEDEWHREAETYALYRRSALNAYARFLERSGPADSDDLFAVFAFISLWLQQDEELGEHHLRNASSALLATSGVIKKAMKGIPPHKFLPLFSQLVAQLGTSVDNKNLEKLVFSIAMEAPLHAVWPLLALTNGHNFGSKSGCAGGGVKGGLHVVDEKKVAIARHIICALKDVSEKGTDGFCKDATLRQRIVCQAERLSSAYIQLAFYRVHNSSRSIYRIPHYFMITEKEMRDLAIPPPTLTLPAFSLTSSVPLHLLLQQVPRIVRYEMTFTTPGGINLPKALRCVLSNGRIVQELLKSEDDLRQDSLIEQVFCLSNELLAKEQETRRLHIFTYGVVPLAPTVGVIEWVNGTVPLGQYINGDTSSSGAAEGKRRLRIGAHERYFPGEPTTLDCRARLHAASKAEKHTVLLELYAEFSPALHYFFFEQFFTSQEWLERREAFTRSVAASSILGYIVGLGDRHCNNLLLHTRSAELVHIDLGFAFDQGRLLPVPELVPFRLTRNIVDGFGVQGTDGPFRHDCEGTLRVLRGRRELLMTVLEACAHDPLARWAVTVPSPRERGVERSESRELAGRATPRQQDFGVSRGRPTYADAERTLSHVAEKIQGYEAGELLSVSTHVQKLLQTAQNTELLAQMYVGWSPWL